MRTIAPILSRTKVPRLNQGDRLSRVEFERRYAAMPGIKAELIEGVVHMASPVRYENHGKPHILLSTWLGVYASLTPGISDYGDNTTVRLDESNQPQPDLFMLLPKHLGGVARISDDDYIVGAPTLAIEVAGSTVNIDLHDKKDAYRRNGVREYLVWRTEDESVDWFILEGDRYEPMTPDATGMLRSRAFAGLTLHVASLLNRDIAGLLKHLTEACQGNDHAEFVMRLRG